MDQTYRRNTKLFFNNIVCFIGVDGSGKSTILQHLKDDLGNSVKVRYFGKKEFEINHIAELENIKATKLIFKLLLWIDLWIRLFKCKLIDKKDVVCCDRYAWDNYIYSSKKARLINIILFKYLFLRPRIVFYCKCNIETSVARKNDIEDMEALIDMKKKADDEMTRIKNVIILDSDHNSLEENIAVVEKILKKTFLIV